MDHEHDVILVVDDNLNNIKIVVDYLKESGFETAVARNGLTGLKRAKLLQPLLILLDVMMPEMDGFEVCRRLKADEITREIPVLFMTALDNIDDKVKAFALGGVDYISKPAQKEEVLARVTAHVRLRRQARELEAARREAEQASRAKSAFLANMSHELRSPLGTILGFSQLLHHDKNLTPTQVENLDTIRRSGEHLLRLIDQVLDLSKIEAGRLHLESHAFDLFMLLHDMRETFRMRCEKKGLQFQLERDPELPHYLHGDELKLRQILINLLTNAVKFTPEGGVTLRVYTSNSPKTPRLQDSNRPLLLSFDIEDSGVGIAPEELDQLFEEFTQTESGRQSREGTGLGLAISRKFVQLMGGEIHASSTIGRGSTFSFDIQCELAEWKEAEHVALETRNIIGLVEGHPRFKLLLVDDHDDSRQLLLRLLGPLGFELREARNGREAIKLWCDWSPDLIFMDIRMPVMNGLEATQRIREMEKGRRAPIVALTANSLLEARQRMLEAGCDGVIYQPFREQDIFDALRQYAGVEFLYGTSDAIHELRTTADTESLDIPAALATCSPEFLRSLKYSAETTEVNKIASQIDSIREQHPQLAQALGALADDFEYEIILQHLRKAEELQQS